MIALAVAAAVVLAAEPASARLFSHKPKAADAASTQVTNADVAELQRAMDEQRYVDAGRMLDRASAAGATDPRLTALAGDLSLALGHYQDALTSFKQLEATPGMRARSLQGQGIALSALGRSEAALAMLQNAVAEDPSAWRAWNAMGGEYDNRRDWPQAGAAYDHALSNSDQAAAVLNNRGFSRLMQGQLDGAVSDLVAALKKKPDLAVARTNLRMAMAMKGEYDRALAGGAPSDQAALLNNAGFAAMMRGDYAQAKDLLGRAIKARGEYYERASANLEMARTLESHAGSISEAPGAGH